MLAFAFAANVFATDRPKVSITPLEDKKAVVSILQETPAVNEISIFSSDGSMVYYKKSKNKFANYSQVYDLSQLEDGDYEFKMKAGLTTVKSGLKINNGKISVVAQEKVLEPFFTFSGNMLILTYLNFEKDDVKVCIYNRGNLIHSTELGNEFTLQKAFDFSKLKSGNYDVQLASANEEYWYSVAK